MPADVGNIHNQIGSYLVLNFEAPILNHGWPSIGRSSVLRSGEVKLTRIEIGRSWIGR